MRIHRGLAVTAALTLALMTASCSSDEKPDPSPTKPAKSASPTPGFAPEDPAANSVPLAGNKDVPIEWVLDDVNGSDPVVDVARRTIGLVLLVGGSPEWADEKKITKAANALSVDDSVLVEPLRGQEVTTPPADAGQVRILVLPPVGEGDHATTWLCIDYDATSSKSKNGVLVSVSLAIADGLWKATDYNLNPEITAEVEPTFQRCRSPF